MTAANTDVAKKALRFNEAHNRKPGAEARDKARRWRRLRRRWSRWLQERMEEWK